MKSKCLNCNKILNVNRKDKRFCDSRCYNHYYNLRNKTKIYKYTKTYRKNNPWIIIYSNILARCNKPSNHAYHRYGGRGIQCKITSDEIKFLWFRDKAYEMKKPNIDRVDNDGDYEISNCRFIEQSENSIRANIKTILQYSLSGDFIREWESIKEASKYYKVTNCAIINNLKGKNKMGAGFVWKYKTDNYPIKLTKHEIINLINNKIRKVIQFTKNNEYIKTWDSIASVNKATKIDGGSIVRCCKGQLVTAGGFVWKYKND